MRKKKVAHLDTDVKEIPPLDVLSESFVHVEYILQRVSGNVERPFQAKWHLIHVALDVLARLRIEPHTPAFEQNDIQGSPDRRPFGLGETISFAITQAFIEARDAYFVRSRAIYFLERAKNGETEGDVVGAREAASAEKGIVRVCRGKGLQLGVRKVEVIDRESGHEIGYVIFVMLSEQLSHTLSETRLSRALWSLQGDENRRCRRRSIC